MFTAASPKKQTQNLVAALILDGESDPGGERYVAAHDAVAAHEAPPASNKCIEPPFALRAARRLAEQLCHDGTRRNAATSAWPCSRYEEIA